jgi:hypothetical protein
MGDVEEVRGVRLQLDEGGRGQQRVPHQHELVLLDTQVRHQLNRRKKKRKQRCKQLQFRSFFGEYVCNSAAEIDVYPGRHMDESFLGDELVHAAVRDALRAGVLDLEQHRAVDIEAAKAIKGRWWHDYCTITTQHHQRAKKLESEHVSAFCRKEIGGRNRRLTPVPVLVDVLLVQERHRQASVVLHERPVLQVEVLLEILRAKIRVS